MPSFFIGIDFGTGGAKACIINESVDTLAYAFREYPILTPHPGWSEHNAFTYWSVCCDLIKECLSRSRVTARNIKGIGVSAALPSLVLVDEKGQPLANAYNLMDRRATAEAEGLLHDIGSEKIFEVSANRLEDHPVLVNLLWEKNNRPEIYNKVRWALTIDGFIRFKLTGEATAHHSSGSFYGIAYDLRQKEFNHEILEKTGLSEHILPGFYPCEKIVGETTELSAQQTGLVKGIPVAAGQVDCNAAWVGAGAIEEGDVQMNLGTCGNFGVITRRDDFLDTMINFPYTVDCMNNYIVVPTTTTGGQSLRYIRDTFAQPEVAVEQLSGVSAYSLLDKQAQRIAPGSEGLIVLPYLMGERTPIWDVAARGMIFGLSLNHNRAHITRAFMEAVAYALYDSFCVIQSNNYKINVPVVLNEGGSQSELWRRIITDVFNVPTAVVKNRSGAPFGDALLAAVSVGSFSDYSIAKEKAEYVHMMEPDPVVHNVYMEYFDLYKKLYAHVKEDFADLALIRNKAHHAKMFREIQP